MNLIELIRAYDEGDLVAAAGIIEEADALADASEGTRAELYREIADSLRAAIRGQDSTVDSARRERWIERLTGETAGEGETAMDLNEATVADAAGEEDADTHAAVDDGEALSFLGNAVGHLSAIVDMLKRYRTGDLTLATEILAETQQLVSDPATPDDALPTIRRIRDLFFEHVRAGAEEPDLEHAGETVDEAYFEGESPEPATEPNEPSSGSNEQDEISLIDETNGASGDAGRHRTTPSAPPAATVQHAMPHDVPLDDVDVVTSFVQESVDHLDDIEHRVLNLEDEYTDDLVNSIFRSIHTIKGVASFVGFSYVSETSHELETLLDEVRNGQQPVTEELITVLLDGTDVISQIVHNIETQVSGGAPAMLVEESFGHREIVARIRALRTGEEPMSAPAESETTPRVVEPEAQTAAPEESSADTTVDLSDAPVVTREMIDAFIEESTDLLDQVEQELLRAEQTPIEHETVDQIFRAIHTVKGNAGFFWFTRVEQRCMGMESALDEYRKAGASIDSQAAGEFLDVLDTVRESVKAVAAAAGSTNESALDGERVPEAGPGDGSSTQTSSADDGDAESPNALGEILVQMGEINEESLSRALSQQQRRLGEILVTEEHVKPDSVEKALEEQAKRRTSAPTASTEYATTRKDIRVDTNKLDKLFDLVGELITAESMVLGGINSTGHHANGNGQNGDATASIAKAASYLQKITREMQEITLSIRMIPLEATFGKMRRLVRDLARRFEKEVTINVSGEDTEMDKNVIEEISDPLVHIIRNSIDHGIETAEQRVAAGKPRQGTVWLSAKHEGNEIWITIQDDGKGLNRDKILQKAIDRGLAQENDAELTDEQIYQFIFQPAFSTADQVSEISGRGVGMDVVRQNIEKLRGKIDLRSEQGQGTTFVLRIPLTLAILDGVTFDIAGTHYSVPTTDLVTFQSFDQQTITRTSADHHGFRLRDEVIPIVQYEDRGEIPDHGVVIVLQSNGRRAALVVDEIVGYRQFVVRAMPGYIQNMRAVSGCSIQGDGSISFIIDVSELMSQELDSVGSR